MRIKIIGECHGSVPTGQVIALGHTPGLARIDDEEGFEFVSLTTVRPKPSLSTGPNIITFYANVGEVRIIWHHATGIS